MKNYAIRASASYFLKLPIYGNPGAIKRWILYQLTDIAFKSFYFHEKTKNSLSLLDSCKKNINIWNIYQVMQTTFTDAAIVVAQKNWEEETNVQVVITLFQRFNVLTSCYRRGWMVYVLPSQPTVFLFLRESWFMWETL